MEEGTLFVESRESIPDDPPDNRILECAVEAEAEFLITGNNNDFSFASFRGIRIVSPRGFVKANIRILITKQIPESSLSGS